MNKSYLAYAHPSVQGYQYGTGRWVNQEPDFWGSYGQSTQRQPYSSLYTRAPIHMAGIRSAIQNYKNAGKEVKECIDVLRDNEGASLSQAWKECKEAVKAVNERIEEAQELTAVVKASLNDEASQPAPVYTTQPVQPTYVPPTVNVWTPPPEQPRPDYNPSYAPDYNPSYAPASGEEQFKKTRNIVLFALGSGALYLFLTRKKKR